MLSSSTPEEDCGTADGEAKASLHLRMRARGIRSLDLLRAFETVPRTVFVPPYCRHLAYRDLPLPIDCGQTLVAPGLLAEMIEALDIGRSHRLLEVGSGTGYATAVLASLADEVIGIERFQRLARAAQHRLTTLRIDNAAILWGDGLAVPEHVEPFHRILVHGVVAATEPLTRHLAAEGVLVCARVHERLPHLIRIASDGEGKLSEVIAGPAPLQAIIPGIAAAL